MSGMGGFRHSFLLYVDFLFLLSDFRPGIRRGSSRDGGEKGQLVKRVLYLHRFIFVTRLHRFID